MFALTANLFFSQCFDVRLKGRRPAEQTDSECVLREERRGCGRCEVLLGGKKIYSILFFLNGQEHRERTNMFGILFKCT